MENFFLVLLALKFFPLTYCEFRIYCRYSMLIAMNTNKTVISQHTDSDQYDKITGNNLSKLKIMSIYFTRSFMDVPTLGVNSQERE